MLKSEPIRVDVPHEAGQWFELRPLSWVQMKEARKLAATEQREIAKDFGAEFVAALTSGQVDEAKARKLIAEQQYKPAAFDTATMLEKGIAAWSYEEDCNEITIAQLDERTAVWAVQAIISLCKPPSDEEVKND